MLQRVIARSVYIVNRELFSNEFVNNFFEGDYHFRRVFLFGLSKY